MGPVISDPRFANIQSDPRYRLPGKNQKIKLDKRFAKVVRDDEFSRKAKVDRYGRPIETDLEKKRLKRKYEFEEDKGEDSDEIDDDDEVQKELQRVEASRDVLREGKDVSSSEDESSSEEESDLEDDVDEQGGLAQDKPEVPLGEVSSRLAVVNLDWDNIRAEDLMAVFTSFLPPASRLLKVAIYPSEFGKERMEREETEGPPKEIFADEDEDIQDESEEEDEEKIKQSLIKPDDGSEFDSRALRQYQLDRLRYFYAVLTFSDSKAAKVVYDKVDGTEYLSTANFFDLRFVPDDTDFSEDKSREECEQIPAGYKPNEFVTSALQHSKVKLTWDAEDTGRKEAQARAFRGSRQDIDENDLKAYLGSDSDGSEEEDVQEAKEQSEEKVSKKEAERQRMRALLGLGAEPVKKNKKQKDVPTGNIQITFSAGLSGAANADESSDEDTTTKKKSKRSVFANSPEPEETTMEKYIRKEKERKKRRKEKMKDPSATTIAEDEAEVQAEDNNDDLGFNDPFFAEADAKDVKSSSKLRKEDRLKKRREREAEEEANAKSRAELELLMADEETSKSKSNSLDKPQGHTVRHFDMNEIEKAQKLALKSSKKKKDKKSKSKLAEAEQVLAKDDFKIDTSDPRFARVFENHEFAIDPTNPRFKGTNAMKSLLEEGRNRKGKAIDGGDSGDRNGVKKEKSSGNGKNKKEVNAVGGSGGDKDEVMSLVEKIKRKNKAQ